LSREGRGKGKREGARRRQGTILALFSLQALLEHQTAVVKNVPEFVQTEVA